MEKHPFDRLVWIMKELRAKCPWDRVQTWDSLKPYIIEEAYEVVSAIEERNVQKLKEELGDLLLQVVFQSEIASESKEFDIYGVIEFLCEKLIRRHPHVFGDLNVEDKEEVLENWEKIKSSEKKSRESLLDGVPDSLPALLSAYRLQEKASRVGFDWGDITSVWKKVEEELGELKEAVEKGSRDNIEAELGDLLFAIANLARFLDVDPESALRMCNRRFKERFKYIEESLREKGLKWGDVNLEYLDKLWEEAKERGL
ncbi:MAG: nucleoside triphosphate pyrophosphohydrolase [Thermosulfidibacteraceae bacterium]|jgi:MazG family protein